MRPLCKLAFFFPALTLFAGATAPAQHPASKPLIVEKVDENQLVALKGNTPPPAISRNDMGRVSAGMPMTDLILVLRRSPETQAAFDAFVQSQYEPSSPNFHHWLSPEQVGGKFGPALSDIATVSAWLTSQGLSVDGVSKDRMTIRFSGSAGRVETAFHTELHNLTVKGVPHFSNMTDPQIPMALAPVVVGPKALNNFIPRPLHRLGSRVTLTRKSGSGQPAGVPGASAVGVRPDIGFSCGSNCQVEDMTPFDFATIYNLTPLWSAGVDGTGQTVAIAGRSDVRSSDVTSFRTAFGLSGGAFNLIQNGTDPGFCTAPNYTSTVFCVLDDQIENALDVEWSGATAPKATIDLVVTKQTATNDAIYESANYIIQHNTAKIINVSYGNCELFLGTSGNTAYNTLWQTAASAGISVFAASGDSGSPACDQGGDSSGTPYAAQYGLAVSGIASTPYDTAVGGTDLDWLSAQSTYWNTSNASNGTTAKGYVPEVPWNDTCTNPLILSYLQSAATFLQNNGFNAPKPTNAESACNFVVNWSTTINGLAGVDISSLVDTVGAGGGASNCTTNSTTDTTIGTCSASGYAKPSWQTGIAGIPPDGKRDIPDVSFFAGNGFNGSAYLICVSDWATSQGTTCLTSSFPANEPAVGEIGGTSAATPAMAGIMALINQKAGSPQGNPNSQLYSLAAKQNYGSCKAETVTNSSSCFFNDIGAGSNATMPNTIAMPCAAASPNCTVNTSGDSVGVLSGFAATAGFDNATGLGSLNVANVVNGWASVVPAATFTLSAAASVPAAISAGGMATSNITVSSTDGYAGTVTLSCALTSSPAGAFELPTCAATSGQSTVTLSAGTTTGQGQVTVSTAAAPAGAVRLASKPDHTGWFRAAGGAALASLLVFFLPGWSKRYRNIFCATFVVLAASFFAVGCGGGGGSTGGGTQKTTPTVTVTPASSSIKESDTLDVNITVKGSGSSTPTGSVTLTSGSYTSTATALSAGAAKITIPAGKLAVGASDTLSVSYTGDANFNAASGTGTVAVTKVATTSGSYTFTVTGTGNDAASTTATTTFTVTVN